MITLTEMGVEEAERIVDREMRKKAKKAGVHLEGDGEIIHG